MSWKAEVKPKPGDLIEIHRTYYQHWAIYIGNGDVVHLAPESEVPGAGLSGLWSVATDLAVVKKEPLWKVVGNDKYQINNKYDGRYLPLPVDEIISRAKAEVGRMMAYNVLSQNCEHFVTGLRYGDTVSDQVTNGVMVGVAAIAGTALAVGLGFMIQKAFERRHEKERPLKQEAKRPFAGH